ncbi:phage tail tape measure protein [Plantibacter sp. Mn2098]|uniref:phage tail tape measure protein n=1 Tax=Plantibacter sp. Mn2098 TaxID=3395266 RepID=UPI003BC5D8A8
MADRTVKVTLTAHVAQYIAGMEKAAQSTRETGTEAEKLAQKKDAFDILGRSLLTVGTVAGVAVGIAVAKFAEFDQAMSNVQAATQESASNMDLLRAAALDAGASTVFTATEAANAIEELGKNGLTTQQILSGGLKGALSLASAGQLDVARAAEIASVSMKQFGLAGGDIPHVADLLAAGAGKAAGDVDDLAQALAQAALVAHQTGLSIEDTTGVLAAFADQGLIGSDAGTSLKTMLQRLTPQSKEAADEIKRLNVEAYDANGQFVGITTVAGKYQAALSKLTPEQRNASLQIIFGSDAVRAASVLYSEGADGIQKYIDQTNDSGYAAKVAADRLNNLAGDVEKLGGSFDTVLIKSGSAANDMLRGMVQAVTAVVDAYGNLPGPVQGAVLGIGGVVAATALAGGTFLTMVPKVAEFRLALEELGPRAQATGRIIGGVSKALGAVATVSTAIVLLDAWQTAVESAAVSSEELANALTTSTSAADVFAKTLTNKGSAAMPDYKPFIEDMGRLKDVLAESAHYSKDFFGEALKTLDPMVNELDDFADGWGKLGKEMAALAGSGGMPTVAANLSRIKEEGKLTRDELYQLISESPELLAALTAQATSAGLAADKNNILAIALGKLGPAAEAPKKSLEEIAGVAVDTNEAIDELAKQIRGFGSAQFDVEKSTNSFYDSLDALKALMDEGGGSLNQLTDQGRSTSDAMLAVASSANDSAGAIAAVGGSTEAIAARLNEGRQRIIDTRIALGDSAEAASAYADRLIATPTAIQTQVTLLGAEDAKAKLQDLQAAIGKLRDVFLSLPVLGGGGSGSGMANGGTLDFYADGGTRENHVAQIAPAGSWRVWAEPETGGEAYIPLSPSKRVRSLNIWQETGRRLGAQGFGSGAVVSAPQYASSSMAQTINVSPTMGDRPIMMDGKLFGVMRQMANGEAQIVVHDALSAESDRSRAGSRRI